MASWKKVVLRGDNATDEQLTLTEAAVAVGSDSIAFVDSDGFIKKDTIVDIANAIAGDALDTDNDGVIDLSVSGLSANSIDDASNDLVLVWDDTSGAWTTASLSDVGSAGTSGVTSVTGSNGVTTSAGTGAITLSLDTSTLGTQAVSGTTEFVVSNSDTEGVAAASDISLAAFSNAATAFIALTNLSVGTEGTASGDGSIAYDNTNGVFTYTPPDLSSYSTTDRFASAFSYTGGTTAGPTGSLTVTGGSAVSFGAIPSASASASGIVTTGTQTFAGDKTFSGAVVIDGGLDVNGTITTIDTTNTTISDKFISLNSGGATDVDTAIVFEGAADKALGWDASQESGRFGVDYAGASASSNTFAPDAWVSTVHTAAGDDTNATAALGQIGNMYINSSNEDIYIYS